MKTTTGTLVRGKIQSLPAGSGALQRRYRMKKYSLRVRCAGIALLCGTGVYYAAAQNAERPSTAMVLRQQWGSLAQEVVDSLQRPPRGPVVVWIQKAADSVLAQNAFLKSLERSGYSATLTPLKDSNAANLTVSVLTDRTQMTPVARDLYVRSVQIDIEVRAEDGNGHRVTVLGIFHRAFVDTVTSGEANLVPVPAAAARENDASLFQRIVGPLIVLASGIVIVYLFFTVRS